MPRPASAPEIIAERKAGIARAEAELTLAQKTFDRTRTLAPSHDLPQAQLDRDSAALTTAERTLDQARLSYQEAVAGFTREDLAIAQAKVESAQADVQTLKSLVDQMVVIAPADSQVFRIPVEDGEFVLPGVPLISLVDLNDMWVQFDLREDLLRDLKVGSRIDVRVPALDDRIVPLEVRVIGAKANTPAGVLPGRPATSTCAPSRSAPIRSQPVEGLRPGMSVYTDWSAQRLMPAQADCLRLRRGRFAGSGAIRWRASCCSACR